MNDFLNSNLTGVLQQFSRARACTVILDQRKTSQITENINWIPTIHGVKQKFWEDDVLE